MSLLRRVFRPDARSERGAALLIVLLLVATLSVLSLAIVQTVTHAYRLSGLSSSRSQALWLAVGVEDFAKVKLQQALQLTEGKLDRRTPGLDEPLVVPVEGGEIRAVISDASNCFNLNSLVQSEEALSNPDVVDAGAFYLAMLEALQIDPTQAREMLAATQDWIDADNAPRSFGAETSFYASQEKPYAAGNTYLASPQEVLAIRGYSPEVFRRIRPLICTLPNDQVGQFNINMLTPDQAPLLAPVFAGVVSIDSIYGQLEAQQGRSFADTEEFFAQPMFAVVDPEQRLDSLLSVEAHLFRLRGEVVYLDTVSSYEAIFERGQSGAIRLLRRRLGVDE
ncbi:type II secretion system minor pseudopilin GspK [Ponticaulis profundi]|uniref:Type II secretion system protein K n=1 Tax=Ponticaulis profundi TaxID=2665222 RepID=A0ABW1S734_9PROT